MAVYIFRVALEDNENVYRDIEIKSVQKFCHLHDVILESFKFDKKHSASFYMSNDQWHKGKEITSDKSKKNSVKMKDAILNNYVDDPHQKIYFVYDLKEQWTFLIELLKINPKVDDRATYPNCIKKAGAAPRQYKVVGKKKPEDELEGNGETLDEKFHNETFMYEEEQMEKDLETLDEGFEILGETDDSPLDELSSSEFDEKF